MCEKCFDDPAAIEAARILTQKPCGRCGSPYTREDFTRLLDERDTALARVEELEKLLGDCGEAEEAFSGFLLTAHALYPSSHPDYYREQGKLAEKRLAVWSEQRRIARARTKP